MDCEACGQPHTGCTAHNRKNGALTPCRMRASTGTTVCWRHGAKTPIVEARRILQTAGRPIENAFDELAKLAAEAVALKDTLRAKVDELDQLEYLTDTGTENVRAVMAAYERALARTESVLATLAKLRIEDRLARVTERQAQLVEQAVRAMILEVCPDRETQAVEAIARHLHAASN